MKVLIIEDEFKIATQIEEHFKKNGFVTHMEHDGEIGHFEGTEGNYDAIILDIGLPTLNGIEVLKKWRSEGLKTPVIILTARDSKQEVVQGLDAGADDYITKPFDIDELAARVRSNIRRVNDKTEDKITYQNVTLDVNNNEILLNNAPAGLTRIEYLIAQYLFINQGRTISVNELVEHVYDDFDNDSGIIARHIANIRKKIGADTIKTDSNRGYFVAKD